MLPGRPRSFVSSLCWFLYVVLYHGLICRCLLSFINHQVVTLLFCSAPWGINCYSLVQLNLSRRNFLNQALKFILMTAGLLLRLFPWFSETRVPFSFLPGWQALASPWLFGTNIFSFSASLVFFFCFFFSFYVISSYTPRLLLPLSLEC